MAKIVKSMAELKSALQKEMYAAMEATVEKSFEDLHENVDHFYTAPEGRYQRTGQLAESPEREIHSGDDRIQGILRLDTSYTYSPSGRDTETIYEYAEEGGLLGYGGFWKQTEVDIEKNMNKEFGKRFK